MRIVVFLLGACAFAQVETPSIGMMLDASGALRLVYGVAGNFTLGPVVDGATPESVPDSIHANEAGIVIRRADASEVRFELAGVTGLRAMSPDWVQVITASGSYALRIERGREALFVLPGAARAEVRRR
jgi:hypothetical protein